MGIGIFEILVIGAIAFVGLAILAGIGVAVWFAVRNRAKDK